MRKRGYAFHSGIRLSPGLAKRLHFGMDSVRFGRALGIGARAAAKTLVTAVDAATSPNPSSTVKGTADPNPLTTRAASSPNPTGTTAPGLAEQAVRKVVQARQTKEGLVRGGKRFGEAVWGPFVRLSGVLWLEFTGVFFGIFALFAATGAWKLRAELHQTAANHDAHIHFLLSAGMALVFGYFFVSSFVKANQRSRKR
jgi:hypothetical protein